eukprot:CAMPEP_0204560492 /NCGR_PEP_ID=MMETSP0661-20131031/32652_1 /ASSEMBLY_ACC=CAM_ASM_000606 /TAXON_ID=109239 /ORGANISM="Alexandrium margalefi, Strain AMGDE01CS-322" /LENGTH=100 /DNA_ID=CAMNT_0051567833 /DNA_START=98 /DNA_END=396 /DNA_ORIENTATION=-
MKTTWRDSVGGAKAKDKASDKYQPIGKAASESLEAGMDEAAVAALDSGAPKESACAPPAPALAGACRLRICLFLRWGLFAAVFFTLGLCSGRWSFTGAVR